MPRLRTRGHDVALVLACIASLRCAPTGTEPEPRFDLNVVVYSDEDGNGQLDPYDRARVPNVTLRALGTPRAAVSFAGTGAARVAQLPVGRYTLTTDGPAALPPFFRAPRAIMATVPSSETVYFPVTLPVGDNAHTRYLTFGDSITAGEGATSDAASYVGVLESRLYDHFGYARVVVDAIPGSFSREGADRIEQSLAHATPAYVTILYGTNDWVDHVCHRYECYTLESLRTMIRAAHTRQTLPVVGTIPPANPDHPNAPPERNAWIAAMNDEIRAMALEEGAVVAEVHGALLAAGDLPSLFVDHVHPNDRGHALIAEAFFSAITRPPVVARINAAPPPQSAPVVEPESSR